VAVAAGGDSAAAADVVSPHLTTPVEQQSTQKQKPFPSPTLLFLPAASPSPSSIFSSFQHHDCHKLVGNVNKIKYFQSWFFLGFNYTHIRKCGESHPL